MNEYFGKLQNPKIEVFRAEGDFGENLSAHRRKFKGHKSKYCSVKWKARKAIIPEMKDGVRNKLLLLVNTISGCPGAENALVNLKESGNFTIRKTISTNWEE